MKEALSGSSSGEAGGEIDGGGNKGPGRGRLAALMAVLVAVIVAACVGLGLYLAFRDRESASSLFDRGARAFEEGRYDEAIDLYKKALEKEPESSIGYNLLGMGYRFLYLQARNTGYREKEVEAFRRAIELDPRNVAALVNLGATLYDQGDRAEAAAFLQKALDVYPDHPDRAQIEEMIRQAGQ